MAKPSNAVDSRSVETLALALPLLAALALPAIWWLIDVREQRFAREHVDLVAEQAALRVQDFMQARLLVVQSVALEVEDVGLDTPARFVRHASALQRQLGGFLAINWMTPDGTIEWVSPIERNRAAIGKNVLRHPQAGPVARAAFETRTRRATAPLTLFQGVKGFASYFPVADEDGHLLGAVNGVFDVGSLVRQALSLGLLDDYELAVDDSGGRLFETPGFSELGPALAGRRSLTVLDRTWRLTVRPKPRTASVLVSEDHDAWTGIGLGTCFVLGTLAWAWRTSRGAARDLEARQIHLEAELAHAQKMEALGRLAGGLAHDFNNLLTALGGHAELALMQDGLDEETQESLEQILAVAGRGREMTQSLLAFSRKQPARVQRFDPGARMRALQSTLRHLVPETVELAVDLPLDAGTVEMDATQLDQIVMNLLVNAVDAMPEGGRLELSLRVLEPEWFLVCVSDTGVGMSLEVQSRIFEPFFTTKASQGTGLGLAQVWDFVRRAGGEVQVRSRLDEGTTVEVRLPRQPPEPQGERPSPSQDELRGVGAVLLVEDEADVRAVLGQALRRAGYRVLEAATLAEARARAEEAEALHALVSDVRLPDGRGPELAASLRRRWAGLPLVFCSGQLEAEDRAAIEALGARLFDKPFAQQDLLKHLSELVAP